MIQEIQEFFLKERGEEIGEFAAEICFEFIKDRLGPVFTTKASVTREKWRNKGCSCWKKIYMRWKKVIRLKSRLYSYTNTDGFVYFLLKPIYRFIYLIYYYDRQSNIICIIIGLTLGGEKVKGKLSSDLLRGHTDTIVLSILQKGDSYGYEIYKTILEKTDDQYELKEATLYSSYRRLEKEGLIVAYWGTNLKGRRKYYRITEKGKHNIIKIS